jgi:hypothetical protein
LSRVLLVLHLPLFEEQLHPVIHPRLQVQVLLLLPRVLLLHHLLRTTRSGTHGQRGPELLGYTATITCL